MARKKQRRNQIQTRDDIVGHLCMRVLFNLQLQQEAIEYIDKHTELRIMQDYVEARFDYLLDKFPSLKQQYEKSATQESQNKEIIMSNENEPYPYDEKKGIQLPPEIEQEIKGLVKNEQKIQAVQRVFQLTRAGLKVSKDYVDGLVSE